MMTVIIIKPRTRHGNLRIFFCQKLTSQSLFAWLAASVSPTDVLQAVPIAGYVLTSGSFLSLALTLSWRVTCGMASAGICPWSVSSSLERAAQSSGIVSSVLQRDSRHISNAITLLKSPGQHATLGRSELCFGHRVSLPEREESCRQHRRRHSFSEELLQAVSGGEQSFCSIVLVLKNFQWKQARNLQHPPRLQIHARADMQRRFLPRRS